ncbi:uncharacterized protein LOC118228116 isoform X2 [Anguilla anguilla]|uniref:uncharacterized protein LOC118228116 isoform X2 n=1 Tax=Anguilla anguilla TaxID=7936 RepID=UPI0015AE4961|nr:uncharacterized protein LOC118228116 isoform X2 [Anguilla anguilla]
MKPTVAACVLLITLQLRLTGSTTTPPQDPDSGEVCSQLKQLQQHKALTGKLKILLEALFEAFCNKNLAKTSTSTTLTSTTLTSTPVPAPQTTPGKNKRENKDFQKPSKSAGAPENASPNDSKRKEEPEASPKSDRKFLWIVLGVLGVLMLVTVLTLKSKVLICTRTYTNAGTAPRACLCRDLKSLPEQPPFIYIGVFYPPQTGESQLRFGNDTACMRVCVCVCLYNFFLL